MPMSPMFSMISVRRSPQLPMQGAEPGRDEHVENCVDEHEQGDVADAVAELLHHQQDGENDEDLPPRAAHEGQGIVEPVALAQHELAPLGEPPRGSRETRNR